jgi:hypothetical protein
MAGYSGTPLPRKLGIAEGSALALPGAPEGMAAALEPLPPGVVVRRRARGLLDVVVLFCTRRRDLVRQFPRWAAVLAPAGGLWVSWPKRSSGVPTDLDESQVREVGLAHGLVDNKVCAIDDTWSGLRFVIRLADRPGARAGVAVSGPRRSVRT